jgi:hypothetical protein
MKKAVLFGVLAAVMLFGIVGLAWADTAQFDGTGDPLSATNSANLVDVTANVNPKLSLTITTTDGTTPGELLVDFGAVDPDTAYSETVDLEVKSNKLWTMSTTLGGQDTEIGLTTSDNDTIFGALSYGTRGVKTGTDTYGILVPWDTPAGSYAATVQYTVTQIP